MSEHPKSVKCKESEGALGFQSGERKTRQEKNEEREEKMRVRSKRKLCQCGRELSRKIIRN